MKEVKRVRYLADHDFHIHSKLSTCSQDSEQTTQAILQYAIKNGLKHICLTDHFWDDTIPGASEWYQPQNFSHISAALPLPQGPHTIFSYGCETDMDKFFSLGISTSTIDKFDFVVVSTTHLQMEGFTINEGVDTAEERAGLYVDRLDALLDMDLPFRKMGIAHLTSRHIFKGDTYRFVQVIDCVSSEKYNELFAKASRLGIGIELNFPSIGYPQDVLKKILRPYQIAKKQNCKFYLGSDAHHPSDLVYAKANFDHIIDLLELTEDEKFCFIE